MLNLFIFNNLEDDNIISSLLRFRDSRNAEDYYSAAKGLIKFSSNRLTYKDIIKEYVIRAMVEKEDLSNITYLRNFLRHDIKAIYTELITYDWNGLIVSEGLIPMSDIETPEIRTGLAGYVQSIEAMIDCESNEALGGAILAHAEAFGTGCFAAYSALKWDKGSLRGIIPDSTSFADLTGLDTQKNILITNTERLLLNKPCDNILLTGVSGTGKSSCVKACLNMFKNSGLRLVELNPSDIYHLPEIYSGIKNDILKYIIFIDNITPSIDDEAYKTIKSVLGSRTESKNTNILIYATSSADSSQFSSLFGINLGFSVPTREEYLNIVEDMIISKGIIITEEMRTAALSIADETNDFSAAKAKQFVRNITAI